MQARETFLGIAAAGHAADDRGPGRPAAAALDARPFAARIAAAMQRELGAGAGRDRRGAGGGRRRAGGGRRLQFGPGGAGRRSSTRLGLAAVFGPRVFSFEDVARPKPAPDIYRAAAAACGAVPGGLRGGGGQPARRPGRHRRRLPGAGLRAGDRALGAGRGRGGAFRPDAGSARAARAAGAGGVTLDRWRRAPFYPWVKAVHLMAVIAWMAGLFYLPRLFVYHSQVAVGSRAGRAVQGDGAAADPRHHEPGHDRRLAAGDHPGPDPRRGGLDRRLVAREVRLGPRR